MMVQMKNKCYCETHTAVCFVSQAGFEPTRFAEQGILFIHAFLHEYIRSNGQIHRFPPFPLLGVGQLCLPPFHH